MSSGQYASTEIEPIKFTELFGELMMQTDALGIYNWIYYVLIYILLIFIYNKVFRTRKLPILKSAIVYILIAIGSFMLLVFQIDAGLPIVYSLGVAVLLMLIVRIRYMIEKIRDRKQAK